LGGELDSKQAITGIIIELKLMVGFLECIDSTLSSEN
jgi:hypothetical protein